MVMKKATNPITSKSKRLVNEAGLRVLLQNSQTTLVQTYAVTDSLDSKALAIIGFTIAIFAINPPDSSLSFVGAYMLLVSSVLAYTVIKIRKFQSSQVDLEQAPEYFFKAEQELLLQLIADTEGAIEDNQGTISIKYKAFRWATWWFLPGACLLIAGNVIK